MFDLGLLGDNQRCKPEGYRQEGHADEASTQPLQMLVLPITITALCAAGAYASVFLLLKWVSVRRDAPPEASVLQTPYATLVPGVPNMALGIAYYAAATAAAWLRLPGLCLAAFGASLFALSASMYLAYRLQRTLKMPCPYCWSAHSVNGAVALLFAIRCFAFE